MPEKQQTNNQSPKVDQRALDPNSRVAKPYNFNVGDQVEVITEVSDNDHKRKQKFSGVVIAKKGKGISKTFTVRRVGMAGVGVERIFPLHSPIIKEVKVIKAGKPRRSKLYYLREREGKQATQVKAKS